VGTLARSMLEELIAACLANRIGPVIDRVRFRGGS
jgi:hypothetical protein